MRNARTWFAAVGAVVAAVSAAADDGRFVGNMDLDGFALSNGVYYGDGGGLTNIAATAQSHATLTGRSDANQHPIAALSDYALILTNDLWTAPLANVSNRVVGLEAQTNRWNLALTNSVGLVRLVLTNALYSVTNNTWTTIPLKSLTGVTGDAALLSYGVETNGGWSASRACSVIVFGRVAWQAFPQNVVHYTATWRNGTNFAYTIERYPTAGSMDRQQTLWGAMSVNAGDYFALRCYHESSSAKDVYGNAAKTDLTGLTILVVP